MTPAERALRARIAAHTLHSKVDGREITAAARKAGPAGGLTYFEKQVDPDGTLPPKERQRRAEHARKAHFARLALQGLQARQNKKKGRGK